MKGLRILPIVIILTMTLLIGCKSKATFNPVCTSHKSGEELTFLIVSDPHYLSKKTYDEGSAFNDFCCTCDGKLLKYTEEIIDALIWEIDEINPDFLIVAGDLTCNGEKESHIQLSKKLKIIEKKGICVFLIPGNHDIENPWARNYIGSDPSIAESIEFEEFAEIYNSFGYQEAISRDESSLSYLVTPSEDLWLLMLDSTKRNSSKTARIPEKSGELATKTLSWIEQCASLAKEHDARLIASMHHSLLEHNPIINQGYVIDNADKALEVFKKSNIEIVLTGHIHLQDIKTKSMDNYNIVDIATGSIVAYPNNYGVLKFNPEYGYQYNSKKINVEGFAKEKKFKDECLINFSTYSKEFFENNSYYKYYDYIVNSNDISEEAYDYMASNIAKINTEFFNGYRNEVLEALIDNRFKIELEKLPDFLKNYLKSMIDDQFTDNNEIIIPIN